MAQHYEQNHLGEALIDFIKKHKGASIFNKILTWDTPDFQTYDINHQQCYFKIYPPRIYTEDVNVKHVIYLYSLEDDNMSYEIHLNKKKKPIKTYQVL